MDVSFVGAVVPWEIRPGEAFVTRGDDLARPDVEWIDAFVRTRPLGVAEIDGNEERT